MPRADIDQLIDAALRRRRRLHAALAIATGLLAIAATLAVRHELTEGLPTGAAGVVVTVLEFVFITAIIPLVVSVIYYGASAVSLHRKLSRRPSIPEARLQRLI